MYGFCLPFHFADWFGIDEGSLQIDDNAVPCLPTGYRCDNNDECCDGMCVLSKLSKHKLCLVVGWKDELKLREFKTYNHNPLRPEDVEYLRRMYNIVENVPTLTTQSQKPRRIRVVSDEDVYDIPPLPDENKLFPITDDPFLYDIITTTDTTTSSLVTDNNDGALKSNYSAMSSFNRQRTAVNNRISSTVQDYRLTENLTNISSSPKPTDDSRVEDENERGDENFPDITNYQDLVKYGFINPEIEGVIPPDVEFNESTNLENGTKQNDFIELDHDYNLKTNEGSVTVLSTTDNCNMTGIILQKATSNISRKNETDMTQNMTTIEMFTETPGIESNQQPTERITTSGADEQLTGSAEHLKNISTANCNITTNTETLSSLQDDLPVAYENTNITLSENVTNFDSNRTPVESLLTPTVEHYTIQNLESEYGFTNTDVQTIKVRKSAAIDSISDGYKFYTEIDNFDSTVEPQSVLSTENQLPLISKEETMFDNCAEMNRSTSFQITEIDESFVNTTVISGVNQSEETTPNYSNQIFETIRTRKLSTVQYTRASKETKPKRCIWRKVKEGGKLFQRKKGKYSEGATTEVYGDDLEETSYKMPFKFNIFKENKTTTHKKSRSRKLWRAFKTLFHKKGNKTDLANVSEPRALDLDNRIEETSQSDYIAVENKHKLDDIDKRYQSSFVLPLNETKRHRFMSNVKGWFHFGRKERIESTSLIPVASFTESSNIIQRARQKFHKIINKSKTLKWFSGTSTNIELHNTLNTTTINPISPSNNAEITTQTNTSQKSKRKFKFWNRIKRVFHRKKQSNISISDNYNTSDIDPAIINGFSIRD